MQKAFLSQYIRLLFNVRDYPTACPDLPHYWGKLGRARPSCIFVNNGQMLGAIAITNNFILKSKGYLQFCTKSW